MLNVDCLVYHVVFTGAGAVDEEIFLAAYEDVPSVNVSLSQMLKYMKKEEQKQIYSEKLRSLF